MRATRNDCDMALRQIAEYARHIGLMGSTGYLTLTLGKDITPTVYAYDPVTKYTWHPSFLPTFHRGYRTTVTDAWVTLCATRDALAEVSRHLDREGTWSPPAN